MVTIKFTAHFRQLAGQKEVRLDDAEGLTLFDAIKKISSRSSPELLKSVFDADGSPSSDVVILKNGKAVKSGHEELRDGDEVVIFPPAFGG